MLPPASSELFCPHIRLQDPTFPVHYIVVWSRTRPQSIVQRWMMGMHYSHRPLRSIVPARKRLQICMCISVNPFRSKFERLWKSYWVSYKGPFFLDAPSLIKRPRPCQLFYVSYTFLKVYISQVYISQVYIPPPPPPRKILSLISPTVIKVPVPESRNQFQFLYHRHSIALNIGFEHTTCSAVNTCPYFAQKVFQSNFKRINISKRKVFILSKFSWIWIKDLGL